MDIECAPRNPSGWRRRRSSGTGWRQYVDATLLIVSKIVCIEYGWRKGPQALCTHAINDTGHAGTSTYLSFGFEAMTNFRTFVVSVLDCQ